MFHLSERRRKASSLLSTATQSTTTTPHQHNRLRKAPAVLLLPSLFTFVGLVLVFFELPTRSYNHQRRDDENELLVLGAEKAKQKISSSKPPLSWAEQTQFMHPGSFNNITYWQTPKPTPSGWWPDADWIQACVSNATEHISMTPFETLPTFKGYRLGDCLRVCRGCLQDELNGTFAYEYFHHRNGCHGVEDWEYKISNANHTTLHKIVDGFDRKPGYVKPDQDTLLVHLRLGDKLEKSRADTFQMLHLSADPEGGPFWRGLKAIKSVYEFLTGIVESNASNVAIRGGTLYPKFFRKSKIYAHCVKEAVAKAGYNVTMHMEEGNPDYDFYFMSHAQSIILTVGGFSNFIGQSVLRRGGRVYGRVFQEVFGEIQPN